MRSKFYVLVFLMLAAFGSQAQNLQIQYDFGETRKQVTTTFEMFKVDDYGSTFTFIDFEMTGNNAPGLAYWEIARSFKVSDKLPGFEVRAEYNGGLSYNIFNDGTGFAIGHAYLAGVQKTWASSDFSKIFTLQANYKFIQGNAFTAQTDNQHTFQITGVWVLNFFNNKLTLTGFADFWKEDVFVFDDNNMREFVFLTEPQIWYNINKSFSVGGEVEMSQNFGTNAGFMVNPTLGVKWNI